MIRLDEDTVQFTDAERMAYEGFQELLNQGRGILEAATVIREDHPGMDPAFYEYLER